MTDSTAPSQPAAEPRASADSGGSAVQEAGAGFRSGRRPSPSTGRARSFRQEQAQRRGERRDRTGVVLVVAVIALGVYTLVTAHPYSGAGSYDLPTPGPTIAVHFGPPAVGTIVCSGGGTAHVERIPWVNSSKPLTSADVTVRVSEIWDGDAIGDPNVVAGATPTNPCAGPAPDPTTKWYVVLASPNGTDVLTYTNGAAWTAVGSGLANQPIQNGSTVILITFASLAGTGRGLEVVGIANGSLIRGSVPL